MGNFKTPNDFLQAYYEHRLKEAQIKATEYVNKYGDIAANNGKPGLDGVFGDLFSSAIDGEMDTVDLFKRELNDFMDGKLILSPSMQLWARCATVNYSNIEPSDYPIDFEYDLGETIDWAEWVCANQQVEMTIDLPIIRVAVSCNRTKWLNRDKITRTKVVRRTWYNYDEDFEIGERNWLALSITLALIKAYDCGIWQHRDE
jgi:hypothetical protein